MPASKSLPRLTEAKIQKLANEQSFQRGKSYYKNGAIHNPMLQESRLWADCAGSEAYETSVTLNQSGVEASSCTCPYDWGGLCKHQVALLLTYVHQPDCFDVFPSLSELLDSRSREDLVKLIERMVQRHPSLLTLVESSMPQAEGEPLNLSNYKKQAQRALRRDELDEVIEGLEPMIELAQQLLDAGDRQNAGTLYQMLLAEITAAYDWKMREMDYDGDISVLAQDCAEGLAMCMANESFLDAKNRQLWLNTFLDAVLKDLELGGTDFAYSAWDALIEYPTDKEWQQIEAQIRAELGKQTHGSWEYEGLVRLLTERLTETHQAEAADALIDELGSPQQQAFSLVGWGKLKEAVAIAQAHFTDLPGLVIQFADGLVKAGAPEQALEYILSQSQRKNRRGYDQWLTKYYQEHGNSQAALEHQHKIFLQSPNINDYKNLQRLAEQLETWKTLRLDLLKGLEGKQNLQLLVEIALFEEDVDWALRLLSQLPRWSSTSLMLQVAQAAEKAKPEQAIALYQNLVTQSIEQKQRSAYQTAATYLQRIKKIYGSQKRLKDWQNYIGKIRTQYRNLPALQDELDQANL